VKGGDDFFEKGERFVGMREEKLDKFNTKFVEFIRG